MVEVVLDIASWTLLLLGGAMVFIGTLGVLRMPDVFTRMHAASITDTLGAALILAGLAIQGGFALVSVKLLLIFVFLLFTSPVSAHAVAKAALTAGVKPLTSGKEDDNGNAAP